MLTGLSTETPFGPMRLFFGTGLGSLTCGDAELEP